MNIQDTARAVAAELGDGWSVSPGVQGAGRDAYLDGPDGVRLHMSEPRYYAQRGRLGISGALTREQWERHYSGTDGTVPSITVAPDKAPKRIAGDIARRLLPPLLPLLAELNERVEQHQAAERERDARVKALAAHIPGASVPQRDPAHIDFGSYGDGGDVDILYGGGVKFEVQFGPDKALKLAEFIGKLQRGEV